jgi:hypothetical protein
MLTHRAGGLNRHNQAARRYFRDAPGRFLEFDIDDDPLDDLVAVLTPEKPFVASHYIRARVADEVMESRTEQGKTIAG